MECLVFSVSSAFGADERIVIYRHVEEDGTICLTNRPDGDERYSVFGRFAATRLVRAVGMKGVRALAEKYGRLHGLDPRLVQAVIQVESGFDPRAVSSAGAEGLMQLMPDTGKELGVDDRFDPDANVDGGVRYLKSMLERFGGDVSLALAAYNAGPGSVQKYGGVLPFDETQNYVRKVLALYQKK